MAKITVVKNIDWTVAWDEGGNNGEGEHTYKRGIDLAFKDHEIIHVGPNYQGPADETLDGSRYMVMPGLVGIHSHPASEPGNKGLNDELGSPHLGQSSLYEYMPIFRLPETAAPDACRFAIHEMLKSGVTTFTDLSGARDGWVDEVAETGIRAVLGPMFRSAVWSTGDGHSVEYDWDEGMGERGLARAIEVVDEADKHPSGRMSAMLCPSQIDTCTPELMKAAFAESKNRDAPMQIHAAQSVVEFNEITQRHGMTPIEFLDDMGILQDGLIISHGIFLNDHPWLHWPQSDDFGRMSAAGVAVAHCPNVFWRRGIALRNFSRYTKAGITVGLGTDTFPHNFLDEMKIGMIACRLMTGDFTTGTTKEMFDLSTIGGAKALRRDDIGRLKVGCKADFVMVDLDHPYMQPLREPVRNLIYCAGDRAVKHVYVHGEQVVRDGEVLTIDVAAATAGVVEGQSVSISGVRQRDWANRTLDEMSPMSFPVAN